MFSPRPTYGQDNNVWKKLDVELAAANYSRDFRLLVTRTRVYIHTVHTLCTVQVEATVAEGQHGGIAIDDVSLTPGCR